MTATALTQIATVFVPVDDQDHAIAFYRDVLGLEQRVDFTDGVQRWVEVAPTGSAFALALVPPSEGRATDRTITRGAIVSTDIDADHQRMINAGVDVDPENARAGTSRLDCSHPTSSCRPDPRRSSASAIMTATGSSSSRPADPANSNPPFRAVSRDSYAPCWWTGLTVETTYSCQSISWARRRRLSRRPSPQRRCRPRSAAATGSPMPCHPQRCPRPRAAMNVAARPACCAPIGRQGARPSNRLGRLAQCRAHRLALRPGPRP